ncbi:myosin-2 heavy chain, non muscle-like isoform X3 [Apis laboriosa]|uniref:myosin-2 heavy chain, non muscle-like isoform X3 n=1 Tax=Apis laboriosa TaxID=183418 RepID=UPI001CC7F612|nr:myosin-2 heavy chain, non muscle-like isoform X3 [Apis laboriosa]
MERKTICTQTSIEAIQFNEKNQDNKVESDTNQFSPCIYLKQKKSSAFWYIDEDPAPQWLIEEALASGTEQTKEKISSNKETESLENVKAEARKENEILQERIVRICTSVLENFGPYSMDRRKCNTFQTKPCRKLKYQKKIMNKLHKKLRMAVTKSNKLKQELTTTRKMLKDKSEEHDSMSKCFDQLKEEMEAAETNLNELISENVSLRKKIDETREWLQQTSGKEHNMIRDTRNREIVNLKKKAEEDSATIIQLKQKNKLLQFRLIRSDSANANKGFLLNSYKSQLKDLTKENNQLASKINSLENEISNIRSTNSQLRAKISVLSVEKDKLLSDKEKSKTDIKEKMETKCAKKCEETIQQEIEIIRTKYEEIIKTLKTKMSITQNENVEYLNAIKEFLKKLYYEYQIDHKSYKSSNESEASEREAQETACNILNMTPDELSGFINGKTQNSINSWIVELNRITKTDHFSKDLSKFLLKKAAKKIKT